MSEKMIINANLIQKESEFRTKSCVVEKAIAVSHAEFDDLKRYPLRDNKLIAKNADLMYCDSDDNYHCLLIYDEEQGDGLLIESEGSVDVTEDVIKGKISIIKHSDDGTTQIETPEEGAEFEVYLKSAGSYENAKETERDHLICDESGFAETKLLPYGVYVVHQIKGWDNTEWIDDFEVIVSENEKNYFYFINDSVITSYVKIVKKDAETGNIIPVSGIGFMVWDCANNAYVSQKINYPSEMTLDTFYTRPVLKP